MTARGPILGLLLGALFGVAGIAFVPVQPVLAQTIRDAELDALFEQLREAPDAEEAHRIDQQIWLYWTTPDDPDLATRMADALAVQQESDWERALVLIDAIVADFPDYAEGWNQRATVNFILGDYEASLADIDKTLEFEPRHFGALTGKALIHREQGDYELAVETMVRALEVHPFLPERALFPELAEPIVRI